jgi:hypothetical protein
MIQEPLRKFLFAQIKNSKQQQKKRGEKGNRNPPLYQNKKSASVF